MTTTTSPEPRQAYFGRDPLQAYFSLAYDFTQELGDAMTYTGEGGTFSEWRDADGGLVARVYGSLRDDLLTDVLAYINLDVPAYAFDLMWLAGRHRVPVIDPTIDPPLLDHPAWAAGKVATIKAARPG